MRITSTLPALLVALAACGGEPPAAPAAPAAPAVARPLTLTYFTMPG